MADTGVGAGKGLIDLIYEASLHADQWPILLDRLSKSFGARGGVLHVHSRHDRRWKASPGISKVFEDYLASGWPGRSDRVSRGLRAGREGFVTDTDLFTEAQIAMQPVYQEFLTPRGLQSMAATNVGRVADGELILSLWGFSSHAAAKAVVPALDALRPHLTRAGTIAAGLQLARARSAVETLELIGVPAVILGKGRRVLMGNPLFHEGLSDFAHDTPRGLHFTDTFADEAVGNVLAGFEISGAPGRSQPLRLPSERRAVLHVLPMRGTARDLMTGARAILVVTSPHLSQSLSTALLKGLFSLTPAEARVAEALSKTGKVATVANSFGITESTVLKQLKSVYEKTETHSQPELLVLLGRYNTSVKAGT